MLRKFTSFSIQKVAHPSGTNFELAAEICVNFCMVHHGPCDNFVSYKALRLVHDKYCSLCPFRFKYSNHCVYSLQTFDFQERMEPYLKPKTVRHKRL